MGLPTRRQQGRRQRGQVGRFEPFRELEDMRERVDRLMDSFWRAGPEGAADVWAPLADVEENDGAWIVKAELPGMRPDDIHVELAEGELRIWGERNEEQEREGDVRERMRRMGRFEYRTAVPPGVEPGSVEASMDNGVLRVSVPKPKQAQPQQIEVKAGGG
jgi:HSP20 family protein